MKLTLDQKLYCSDTCPIGKAKKKDLLDTNNSGYDAALDMLAFVEHCSENCERYKLNAKTDET